MKKRRRVKKKTDKFSNKFKRFFSNLKHSFFDEVDGDINSKSSFSILEVVFITFISVVFGIVIGYILTYSRNYATVSNSKASEIVTTYQNILDNYYEEVDDEALADAAIQGMIHYLDDPYSNYLDQSDTSSFNESVDGFIVGIGVVVTYQDDYNVIIKVNDDSPASKVGLQVDDVIIRVDQKDVNGLYGSDLTSLIRGEVDTDVVITVLRGEEELDYTVTRAVIELEVVHHDVLVYEDMLVGYIQIDSFASNSYTQFKKALDELEKKKIESLVIDVRSNSGGHLLQTKQILSMFFNKKTVLYQIENRNRSKKVYSDSKESRSYPIAVLINNGSASASEILASCFQDNYKNATIVGTNSYGKGTVQKSQDLSSGSSIKYTTQKWLTAKGEWLNDVGVSPDVYMEQSDAYYENMCSDTDVQLQAALKALKESN